VEDPSEDYQRVRDFVDTRNCMELESFSPENIQSGFTKEIVQEAREKFKINKVRDEVREIFFSGYLCHKLYLPAALKPYLSICS